MDLLKQLLVYAVLVVVIYVGVLLLQRIAVRVSLPSNFTEMPVQDADHYPTFHLTQLGLSQLRHGDIVCYDTPVTPNGDDHSFGYIVALPGDTFGISGGAVAINGTPDARFHVVPCADCPPLPVPAGHVMILTLGHQTDSLVRGPLPASVVRGRVENFE